MTKDPIDLIIIPARGGSKGIPRKNLQFVAGLPLIAWTIRCAIEVASSNTKSTHVLVSTDDEEIAQVARTFGADVPFIRPAYLASDTARSHDVVLHALDWVIEHVSSVDQVVIMQCTSPFTDASDILAALQTCRDSGDPVVAVAETSRPADLFYTLPEKRLHPVLTTPMIDARRQERKVNFAISGNFYIASSKWTYEHDHLIIPEVTMGHVIDQHRAYDIDEPLDLVIANAVAAHFGWGE